jgi:stress-induced morphogen
VGTLGVTSDQVILSDQVSELRATIKASTMPIQIAELEQAVRDAFPVEHLQIEDQSSGCGENYFILLVSQVGICSAYVYMS